MRKAGKQEGRGMTDPDLNRRERDGSEATSGSAECGAGRVRRRILLWDGHEETEGRENL